MKRTLSVRLLICFLLATLSIFLLLNTYGMNLLSKKLTKRKEEQLSLEANLIASEYLGNFYGDSNSIEHLNAIVKSLEKYLSIRTWIVNPSGEIIVDSSYNTSLGEININDLDPDFLGNTVYHHTEFPGLIDEPMLSYIHPVVSNYRVRGYIVLHLPEKLIIDQTYTYIDAINLSFLIFFIILSAIFIYIYYITIVPLNTLIKVAKEYGSGNFEYKFTPKGLKEFRELGSAISYMGSELNKLDDYQKKFVANISHDFRSPLTSIKGFAEAILDGTIPRDMQDKYLNIILFETERLTKLTSNLLELNSFQGEDPLLDIISFDINHIIKQTAESFEKICIDKKITLNLVFFEDKSYVNADIGKIQQVLYNLIDNALKFSDTNSSITVSTEERGEKLFVSVKDSGIGIAKESQNKVWERFYKTDASRGKDKKGTGLGLSITKEIIQAHGENINLISTEGVGSEFIFSLPKSQE